MVSGHGQYLPRALGKNFPAAAETAGQSSPGMVSAGGEILPPRVGMMVNPRDRMRGTGLA
jgi:hypothetical protein